MKRLLIIIAVIVYLIGICAIDSVLISRRASVLDSELSYLYNLAEKGSDLLEVSVSNIETYWEDNEFYFALVTNHRLTDELDEQILMLKHYAGIDDKQHLMAKIAECRSLLFEIVRDDNIALHNIF